MTDTFNPISANAFLVHAYARGESRDGSVDWSDVDNAWEAACKELGPERVDAIRAIYGLDLE